VAGKFKGRRLAGPRGSAARPTSDKVREALFSIIGSVDGARVLDLFAGTGALGIEALSRGAAHVTFVENDRRMRAVIAANLETVSGGDQSAATVAQGDALRFVQQAAGDPARYDLVLIDPPYPEAPALSLPLAGALPRILAEDAIVVAECDRRSPLILEQAPQANGQVGLSLVSERKYGDTLIRILSAPKATN
jgi:16S rRNA (guanine966-N2)-methyltransferase